MNKHGMAKRNSQIKRNNQIKKIKFSPELIQMLAEQQQTLQEGQTQQQRINKAMVEVFGNLTNESKQEIKAYTDAQLGRVDERIDRIEKMIPLTDGEAMMLNKLHQRKLLSWLRRFCIVALVTVIMVAMNFSMQSMAMLSALFTHC